LAHGVANDVNDTFSRRLNRHRNRRFGPLQAAPPLGLPCCVGKMPLV
jgi:hypothetical protein